MNKVILMGRLAGEPDIRFSPATSTKVASYRLAVDRKYKKEGGQTADFISCVCFGKNADFVENYLKKGTKIVVTGSIQTGSYEKDGKKVYTTNVLVDEHEFCESKANDVPKTPNTNQPIGADGFLNIPDGIGDSLPFN